MDGKNQLGAAPSSAGSLRRSLARVVALVAVLSSVSTAQADTPSEPPEATPPQPAAELEAAQEAGGSPPESNGDSPASEPAAQAPEAARQELEAGQLTKLPKQSKFVEAEYPAAAAEQQIEADVILLLDIDEQGYVTSASPAEPATVPGQGFEDAAIIAALQFEFEPAEMDGQPIAVQISYRYRFELKPELAEPEAEQAAEQTAEGGTQGAGAEALAASLPEPVKNFSGQLLERGTRLPLTGALITVFRQGTGGDESAAERDEDGGESGAVGYEATADDEGRFAFFNLEPGNWKVLVEPPGYYPFRTNEDVADGEAIETVYYVERASYNPYDVVVTGKKPRKEVSRTQISARLADKIPGTAGDPLKVIQNFAGVARVPAFSGQVIVRGSAPQSSRFYVDGIEVPNVYHFGGLRSVLPVGMLEAIDFYPGNFGPEFGRATGGVIDVGTKRSQPKKIGGYLDVSLLDTGLYLEVPVNDELYISVAGRRSYIDGVLAVALPDDAPISTITAPVYYDAQLLVSYRPAPEHELRLFSFLSDDVLAILFDNPGDVDLQISSASASASNNFYRNVFSYRYVPSESFANDLRFSSGRDKIKFGFGDLGFNLNVYQAQIRNNVMQKLSNWLTLNYGLDFLFQRADGFINLPPPPNEGEPPNGNNFDLRNTSTTAFENNDYWSPAVYLEAEVRPIPALRLYPGLRVEHFSRVSESAFSPRLLGRYELAEKVQLKGGVGLFVQEPFFNETDPAFGNPDLGLERSMHYSAGVEYRPEPWITLDATVFYKDLWDQASPTDNFITRDGQLVPEIFDNNGKGRVYGLEFVARHDFTSKFTGFLAYTFSRAERTDSGDDESRLFDFDQPHILTLVASYLLPRNWQVGTRFRLVSGNPTTPVIGSVFNASREEYSAIFGAVNTGRESAFHQLDIRIDKRWIYDGWMLNVYLDIQNVYNRANSEGTDYNFNFRQSQPQSGLPIFPILGVRGEF